MSDRGQVKRASGKARRTKAKKTTKKAVKKTTASRPKASPKAPVKSARVKVVWEVCSGSGKAVKTYPYPDKAAAEAKTAELTRSTGRTHMLRATKVPMD